MLFDGPELKPLCGTLLDFNSQKQLKHNVFKHNIWLNSQITEAAKTEKLLDVTLFAE